MMSAIKKYLLLPVFRRFRKTAPTPIKKLFYRAGLFFSTSLYLERLKERGVSPTTVIDIGAYEGEWTTLFKSVFPESKVLMLEAQNNKAPVLQEICDGFERDVDFSISLLGEKDHEKVTFVEMETGSSVLEESSPYHRDYLEKETITLDSLLLRYPNFKKLDFLKLDVQGYELNVLRGASQLLEQTEFVLMETSLVSINKGCPLIADVIEFMAHKDFRVLDFCSQIRRKDGVLWQTDLLFVKNTSDFVPSALLTSDNWS
ncbi:MAG: FkbM family methyltransferase [Cyanobacteria bacterium J06649_11]